MNFYRNVALRFANVISRQTFHAIQSTDFKEIQDCINELNKLEKGCDIADCDVIGGHDHLRTKENSND